MSPGMAEFSHLTRYIWIILCVCVCVCACLLTTSLHVSREGHHNISTLSPFQVDRRHYGGTLARSQHNDRRIWRHRLRIPETGGVHLQKLLFPHYPRFVTWLALSPLSLCFVQALQIFCFTFASYCDNHQYRYLSIMRFLSPIAVNS